MTAAEKLARALGGRKNGHGWLAPCPAHDDHRPSLAIDDGHSGAPVMICRAGCSQDAVLDALRSRGLWRDSSDDRPQPKPTPRRNGHGAGLSAAIPAPAHTPDFAALLGTAPSAHWTYFTAAGEVIGHVCRIDKANGKVILPISWDGSGWVKRAFSEPRPLYNLPGLAADPRRPVLLCEGEKAADAAAELVTTHTVTTWPGGSGAVGKADFSPLNGRDVVLWPDNDDAGRKAMRAIADMLTGARMLRGVKLPDNLPKGWDLADALPDGFDPVALIEGAVDLRTAKLEALKITSAAEICAREFKPPRWAVPDFVPEGLAILAGRPKTGKSWLTLDFAVAVAGGAQAMGNIPCDTGDVLALLLEDTERRLSGRLKAVLQGAPAPARLQIATTWSKADEGGLDDLKAWLIAHSEARLVIVDTLAMIRGRPDRDKGVYRDDYEAVSGFKRLADEFCVPILLVHHLRKESSTDPLDSVSGTAGLTGSADTILVLKREPNDPHALLYVRGRDVLEAQVALRFDNDTGRWMRLGAADDFRKTEERRAILRTLIDGGPMTPREIADATGRKSAAVRMMLTRMTRQGEVSRLSDGRYAHAA